MATPKDIGSKYGSSISDFATASANVIEDLLIIHCNEGIKLMRNKIYRKTKTGTSSTLAQGIENRPVSVSPNSVSITTISNEAYHDYVDKGVRGVKYNKAPQSKYKFKNLGTPPAMVNSFKKWIAKTGIKNVDGVQMSFKGKKRKTALSEQEKAARTLAVRTKIGGIKPVNYVEAANNKARNTAFAKQLATGMAKTITSNIKRDINGNNNK